MTPGEPGREPGADALEHVADGLEGRDTTPEARDLGTAEGAPKEIVKGLEIAYRRRLR